MSWPIVDFSAAPPYQQVFDYDVRTDLQPVYIGWATPGAATSEAKWRIRKLAYNSDGSVSTIKFMNGSVQFNQIWDNRASLNGVTTSYS